MSENSNSDSEKSNAEPKYKHKTDKGIKMANAIAEHLLTRYLFPGMTDKRKISLIKQAFMDDM